MKWKFALVVSLCALGIGCGGRPADPAGSAGSGSAGLPLQRGFYVASDTACSEASNATLLLVSARGINSSRTLCDFKSIEQTGSTQYRVTLACNDIHGDPPESLTEIYRIPDATRFSYAGEGSDGRAAYRHCAQSSLPEPWRDNDISD